MQYKFIITILGVLNIISVGKVTSIDRLLVKYRVAPPFDTTNEPARLTPFVLNIIDPCNVNTKNNVSSDTDFCNSFVTKEPTVKSIAGFVPMRFGV
jgi:hypothetical protein